MVVFEGTVALAKEKKMNAKTKGTKETNAMMEDDAPARKKSDAKKEE
jgi:hypothetical protein